MKGNSNQGRHLKFIKTDSMVFPKSRKHTPTDKKLVEEWEALSKNDKALWLHNFQSYKEARLHVELNDAS